MARYVVIVDANVARVDHGDGEGIAYVCIRVRVYGDGRVSTSLC